MGKKYTFDHARWTQMELNDSLISVFVNDNNGTLSSEGICIIQNDKDGIQIKSLEDIKSLKNEEICNLIEEAIVSTSNDLVPNLYIHNSYDINDFINIIIKKMNSNFDKSSRIYFRLFGSEDNEHSIICAGTINNDIVLVDDIVDKVINKLI